MSIAPTPAEAASLAMLTRLDHLVRSSRIYPDGHAALLHAGHAIGDQLTAVLAGQSEATLHIIEDRVLVGNRLVKASPGLRGAIRELGTFWALRGVGGLRIQAGANEADVQPLVRLMLDFPGDGGPGPDTMNRELAARGVQALGLLAPRSAVGAQDVGGAADPALAAMRLFLRSVRCTTALHTAPITAALRVELAHIAHEVVELYISAPRRALALVRPKELVPYHLAHPFHVAVYAVAAGQGLGFDHDALEELVRCALALAPGLTASDEDDDDEVDDASTGRPMDHRETLHHARAVRHLLADGALDPSARRVLRTVFEHDMGLDGTGPPATLRWTTPHTYTPILCAAADFAHLRAGHGVGRKYAPDRALEKLRADTGRYHPDVLGALQSLLPELEVISAYV